MHVSSDSKHFRCKIVGSALKVFALSEYPPEGEAEAEEGVEGETGGEVKRGVKAKAERKKAEEA